MLEPGGVVFFCYGVVVELHKVSGLVGLWGLFARYRLGTWRTGCLIRAIRALELDQVGEEESYPPAGVGRERGR